MSKEVASGKSRKISNKEYNKELANLQIELVKLQEWIKEKGLKVVCIFEGRDAAGKGGTIKRITQRLNPRVCRIVALGKPTDIKGDVVVIGGGNVAYDIARTVARQTGVDISRQPGP